MFRLHKGKALALAVGASLFSALILLTALSWWISTYIINKSDLQSTQIVQAVGVGITGSLLIVIFSVYAVGQPLHNWLKKYEIGGS